MATERTFYAFIDAIDNSVAGTTGGCSLSVCVADSANCNMVDGDDWAGALATAEMIMDAWEDYYPELIK